MDEVIIEKQEYLLFDKYKLNTNRNITRYEYISNVPLKVSKREPDMRVCKCGAHLITLAYIFDNNIFRSRTLLGRKCPCCGHNYFTLKTIALCEEAFTIVEYTDLEENIGKEVQVDMYEVKRGDIYFADLTGIEHHCGSEQTGWRPVMIVQNDVGNYYSTIANVRKMNDGIDVMFHDKVNLKARDSQTDKNLVRYFELLGKEKIDKKKYPDLFFCNCNLGYRRDKYSGNMTRKILANDAAEIKSLIDIIEPENIICLGLDTSVVVIQTLIDKKFSCNRLPELMRTGEPYIYGETHIYPVAHPGYWGTRTRGEDNVIADWMRIRK